MKYTHILVMLGLVCLTTAATHSKKTPLEKPDSLKETLQFITNTKQNMIYEFPDIYDKLATRIEDDATEQLMITQLLKKEEFKVIGRGRGNYPPRAVRIVTNELQKGDCYCEVSKIYYPSADSTYYEPAERIRCMDSLTYFNKR